MFEGEAMGHEISWRPRIIVDIMERNETFSLPLQSAVEGQHGAAG
jgi:hypothetical protein